LNLAKFFLKKNSSYKQIPNSLSLIFVVKEKTSSVHGHNVDDDDNNYCINIPDDAYWRPEKKEGKEYLHISQFFSHSSMSILNFVCLKTIECSDH
ncbi:hypothetical protein DERP_012338, partial [Dermatophagoides pteronyssinus]